MLPAPLRIAIADDHPVVRLGIRSILQAETTFNVLGEATEGRAALNITRQLKPDVLLLDVAMPNGSGIDVLRQLKDSHDSSTQVILLTAGIDKQQLTEALKLGARGVVLKDSAARDVVRAIHTVASGQYWIAHEKVTDLVQALQQLSQKQAQPAPFGLTTRELQVVSAVVEGCTNKDIAQRFAISEETVKRHLTNVFDKVGVSNRLELGLFAINHHLTGG